MRTRLWFACTIFAIIVVFVEFLTQGAGRMVYQSRVSANAGPQCDARKTVLETLARKYRESPVAVGVTNNGGLVEVLSASKGSTWTIIVTTPKGRSCLVAAGEAWREVEHVALDPKV